MYRITLINMPFAALRLPSLALTQLASRLRERFDGRVTVETCYLNHDVAQFLGVGLYHFIAHSADSNNSGLGDWFFRQAAFPDAPDNTDAYFRRYFPNRNARTATLKAKLLDKRPRLDEHLAALIREHRLDACDLVGFSSMFMQTTAGLAMARAIKDRHPRIITVMGGANCEPPMGEAIAANSPQLDFVFTGPGLVSFPAFVDRCLEGNAVKSGDIAGVVATAGAGLRRLGLGAATGMGEELPVDTPIPLDYGPFLTSVDRVFPDGDIQPSLLFETSRGCWWGARAHCTFCGLNGSTMSYRSMAPDRALEQFNALFAHADRVFFFECVDNIMPQHYPKDVFAALNAPPDASIFYEVKADLSADDLAILSRARVNLLQPGIESLSTATLKLMKKGTSAFQNVALLKNCVVHDLFPIWNILMGFPGEDEEAHRKCLADLPALAHLPPPAGVLPVRFDRYSPYFTRASEYGLALEPMDFYELIYPFDRDTRRNLAYYFMDQNLSAPHFKHVMRWFGPLSAAVDAWRALWSAERSACLPKLHLTADATGPAVYDSRRGEAVVHPLGAVAKRVLERLSTPRDAAALHKELPDVRELEIEETLAWLRDRQLIFQENDRMLSLVLPQEPSPMRSLTQLYRLTEFNEPADWLTERT